MGNANTTVRCNSMSISCCARICWGRCHCISTRVQHKQYCITGLNTIRCTHCISGCKLLGAALQSFTLNHRDVHEMTRSANSGPSLALMFLLCGVRPHRRGLFHFCGRRGGGGAFAVLSPGLAISALGAADPARCTLQNLCTQNRHGVD